jgi:ABC-type antimicrobial peptide transport system permease subunit
MRDAMAKSLGPVRVLQIALGVAGLIALILTAGALYGLVCFTLERRVKEIGIRNALGATRAEVLGLVVICVTRLTAVGLIIGVAIAAGAMRLITSVRPCT